MILRGDSQRMVKMIMMIISLWAGKNMKTLGSSRKLALVKQVVQSESKVYSQITSQLNLTLVVMP